MPNRKGTSASLFNVMHRIWVLPCLLILTASGWAQNLSGTYRPEGSPAVNWQINEHQTMLWDNAPYLPVGLRIDGIPAEVNRAKAAGIGDVLVNLPASGINWDPTIKAMEAANMRYLIGIDSLAPLARGFVIEPQTYRIGNITEDTKVDMPLPGASNAMVILVTTRDFSISWSKRVALTDGHLIMDIQSPNSLEHTLLVYPEMASLAQPDYWEGFDTQRDALLASLKRNKLGKGFRGIVNPMGALMRASSTMNFVPSSPYFRYEFKSYLTQQYRNIETVQRAWSMSVSNVASFDDLARLVPLWSSSRGISELWDPQNDQVYQCDNKHSSIWSDIQTTINSAGARRYERLINSIKQVTDVPVLQDWTGWASTYEGAKSSLSGLGMRVSGTSAFQIGDAGSQAASSILRWPRSGWLCATDVDLVTSSDGTDVGSIIDELSSMGARGWFFKSTDKAIVAGIAGEGPKRAADTSIAGWSPIAVYFPESARNPAMPQKLPGGRWWLPSPANGNRLDFGSSFFGYRYSDGGTNNIVMWTTAGAGRYRLRLLDPKKVKFAPIDGSDPNVRFNKTGVELTISDIPIVISGTDDIPIPEIAFLETVSRFEEMEKVSDAQHRDTTEESFTFRDSRNGFERAPSGSFIAMRSAYWRMTLRLAKWNWIEAESTRSTNFSDYLAAPGASGGNVLNLRAPGVFDPRGFFAEYDVPVRSGDELEVWVAARIPTEEQKDVRIVVGGQTLTIQGEGQSPYGAGFAWYPFGTTKLRGGSQKLTVQVLSSGGVDLALDTIVLYPGNFVPHGVIPPDAIAFPKLVNGKPIKG